MEGSRLKNIVILILLLTNLCLLFFAVQRRYQEHNLQDRALDDVIRVMASKGIAVERSSVPDAGKLLPLTTARDVEKEKDLAQTLLGENMTAQTSQAEVYRYSSGKGFLQFHSTGAFYGEFSAGAFPAPSPQEDCLHLLEQLDIQAEFLNREGDTYVFRQRWKGVPLFSQQISLTVEEGSILSLTARQQLAGEPLPDSGRQTITTTTALMQILSGITTLGDVCSRVDGFLPGYKGTTSLSDPMILTPIWSVTTDTGSYQLDLVTGELSRSSQNGTEGP